MSNSREDFHVGEENKNEVKGVEEASPIDDGV